MKIALAYRLYKTAQTEAHTFPNTCSRNCEQKGQELEDSVLWLRLYRFGERVGTDLEQLVKAFLLSPGNQGELTRQQREADHLQWGRYALFQLPPFHGTRFFLSSPLHPIVISSSH